MASQNYIDGLLGLINDIRTLEEEKIIRKDDIGSKQRERLEQIWKNIINDCNLLEQYIASVHDDTANQIISALNQIYSQLYALHQENDLGYSSSVSNVIGTLEAYYNTLIGYKADFLVFKHEEVADYNAPA